MTEENKINNNKKMEEIIETKEEDKEIKEKMEAKKEDKEIKEKKDIKKKVISKPTKEFVTANLVNLKISTKYAISICKFIKNKTVEQAILDLEQVILKKKAVPMKGEIPHRHGKGMMSGRFPERAASEFISSLKNSMANALSNGIDNPVIVEAVANIGNRPFARYGIRRKRTHLKIKLKNKVDNSKVEKKKKTIKKIPTKIKDKK